jgi:hypothetical protein
MTAVLQGPGPDGQSTNEGELVGFAATTLQPVSAALGPAHCGLGMSLSHAVAADDDGFPAGPVWPVWSCTCGFRLDADASEVVGSIWSAAARLESLQWEMDTAREALGLAIRQAAVAGVAAKELQLASGLDDAGLRELLG